MHSRSNTFDPNTDVPDLSGKVYVVTGGSAGIGFGICAHLLQHGPERIYLLGKKEQHLAEANEALEKYGDVARVISPIQVDLEDLKATDEAARRLAADLPRLDGLVLNAGLGVGKYAETAADGLDSHMQVNVWAQFHVAMTLLPALRATPGSRLVLQSSDLHRVGTGGVTFADLAEINRDVGPSVLYNRSKLAQVLLVRALHRRKLRDELGLVAGEAPWLIATHPGAVSTDQQEQAVEAYGSMAKAAVAAIRPFMKDPVDEGCRPALFAATSGRVVEEKIDGAYIVPDCKVTEPSSQAQDEELQERLWNLTVDVLKERLGDLRYLKEQA
ncbi:putative secondary metabolism biosynthetic enzyme [Diaporthe australafricana]|uniref:Secondary metabolism biosynthetic enzyme n=1 Tax=Diaporthe australafricana TaxID=127596 RepID=A0ABR3X563_9PEZI